MPCELIPTIASRLGNTPRNFWKCSQNASNCYELTACRHTWLPTHLLAPCPGYRHLLWYSHASSAMHIPNTCESDRCSQCTTKEAFGSSRLDFFGCLPNSLRSVFILFISFGSTWVTKFLSDAAYKHNHTGSYANICIKGKVLWMKHVERAVLRRGLHSVPNNASVLNSSASRSLPWEISNPAV